MRLMRRWPRARRGRLRRGLDTALTRRSCHGCCAGHGPRIPRARMLSDVFAPVLPHPSACACGCTYRRGHLPVSHQLVRARPFECASRAHIAVRSCLRCAFPSAHSCAADALAPATARAPLCSAVANTQSTRAVGSRSASGRDSAIVSGCFELVECCIHAMPDRGPMGKVVVYRYAFYFLIPQAKK